MATPIELPEVPDAQRSPLIEELLARIEHLIQRNRHLEETVQQLRDEIAVLKGEQAKPKFKASGMARASDAETGTKAPGHGGEREQTRRLGQAQQNRGTDDSRGDPGATDAAAAAGVTVQRVS